MKFRARSRSADLIRSNQLSKSTSSTETARRLCGIAGHGVVSNPALQRRMIFEVDHPGDYATLDSYHSRDGTIAACQHRNPDVARERHFAKAVEELPYLEG